jgi:hypothetical protein
MVLLMQDNSDDSLDLERRKQSLEIEKLSLEKKLLQRQLAKTGVLWEWMKALAAPVAIGSAWVAFFIGVSQIEQTEKNRTAERLENALVRLQSGSADERMAGVSGLELFLQEGDREMQRQSLHFLVSRLKNETNLQVQSAIVTAVDQVGMGVINEDVLNEALRIALKDNRDLAIKARDNLSELAEFDRDRYISRLHAASKPWRDTTDDSVNVAMTASQFVMIKSIDYNFGNQTKFREQFALMTLAKIIERLHRLGSNEKL